MGSLSGIATTFMERNIAFWAAYLLPACFLWLAVVVLLFGRRRFGSLIYLACRWQITLTEPSSSTTGGICPEVGLQSVFLCFYRKIQDGCGEAWFPTQQSRKRGWVEWFLYWGAQTWSSSLPCLVRPPCLHIFYILLWGQLCADFFLV